MVFGEVSVVDDGRRVVTPWARTGAYVGDRFFASAAVLRLPDAALDGHGRVWVAAGSGEDRPYVMCDAVGQWWPAPQKLFGARVIVRASDRGCLVAFTTSATTYAVWEVDAAGTFVAWHTGAIPDGSGGNGMRGWDAAGFPLPMSPLDAALNGVRARAAVSASGATVACRLEQDEVLVARGTAVGTLSPGLCDWTSLRLSANGRYWAGCRYSGEVMLGGAVPLAVPPLAPVLPHVAPLGKPCWAGWAFAWSQRYGSDPAAPENFTLVVEGGLAPACPVVVARVGDDGADLIAEWRDRWARVVAVFVTSEKGPLQYEIAQARSRMDALGLPRKPFLSYAPLADALAVPFDGWVGVECYQEKGEPLAAAEHRWRNDLQAVVGHGRRAGLWGGASDRGFLTTDQLRAAMARYPELLRSAAACDLLCWFAWGRPTGGKQHGLGDWASATVAATTAPDIPSGEPMSPTATPKGTIAAYGPPKGVVPFVCTATWKLTQGRLEDVGEVRWLLDGQVVARNSPGDPDHHYAINTVGDHRIDLELHSRTGALLDRTGSVRTVRGLANQPQPQPPEPEPQPPEPPTGPTAHPGLIRAQGRHFVSDAGRYWPLGATLMWALFGWRNERDRVKQNLAWLKGKRVDYVRVLGQVGWAGRAISESWPDYQSLLEGLVDHIASLGMRTQVTMIGGERDQVNPDLLCDKVIQALKPRPLAVQCVEVANEWFANFEDEPTMKRLGDRLKAALPNLVALSSPNKDEADAANRLWVPAHGSMGMAHMDRDDKKSDWKWRHVRKPWEAGNGPSFPSDHNEPGGPRSSVAEFPEAIHCAMMRATAIVMGWEGFVLHNGAGVMGVVDPAHNRPANLWEVPGIDAVMDAVRGVDLLIPAWASDGQATRGGVGGPAQHPFAADMFWPDTSSDHGVVRDYARVNGDQFVQVLLGVKSHVTMRAQNRNWRVQFQDPITRKVVKAADVPQGQSVDIGVASADSRGYGAWVVRGTAF